MPLIVWVKVPPRPIQKAVLVQLLRHPLRLQGILADVERFKHLERRFDQSAVGEDAAISGDAFFRMHGDQGMDGIIGPDLG